MKTETETLVSTDNPFERARKAWKVMGFKNDRLNQVETLAEVFMVYQNFDRSTTKHEACHSPIYMP